MWSISERDGRFCVVNGAGKVVFSATSSAEADKLLQALLISTKEFSAQLSPTASKDYNGKVFNVGIFPDKGFSLSLAEMADAIAAFEPVDIDIEHKNTIFDGKLGKLESISFDDQNFENLNGQAKLPLWLSEVIGDDPIKVSCQWDTAKKKLTKLSLVKDPRIEDAKLSLAFSKSEKPPKEPNMPELDEETRKGFLSVLADFFKGPNAPPVPPALPVTDPPAVVIPAVSEAQFSALQAEMAVVKAQALQVKANSFIDNAISEGYADPADREVMLTAFSFAQQADIGAGLANFSSEDGPAVKSFKALYTKKRHGYFSEEMPADLSYLESTIDLSKAENEEVKHLLGFTNIGRSTLKEMEGK